MKTAYTITRLTLAICLLAACTKDQIRRHYTFFRPVYSTKEAVRANVKSNAVQPMVNPGKIFYKDGYLFVSELDKGVHVINATNPAQPRQVAFVNIPGCIDLAVRGNILYADMYTDLIAIDITNPDAVKLEKVLEGVFPHRRYDYFTPDTSKIITNWVRVDTVVNHAERGFGWGAILREVTFLASTNTGAQGGISNGQGGSMARFALASDRLYTVSNTDLKTFNVAQPQMPAYVKTTQLGGWNIETIFPFGQSLFIGTMQGMLIYDITNKDNPSYLSKFEHATVCDPVITDGIHAYITLRDGTECRGFTNQLDIVDVRNLRAPYKISSWPMTNPHGLAKDGNLLLVCEGKSGLKILNVAQPTQVSTLSTLTGMETYDVLALNGYAAVVAKDGLYMINYTQPAQPVITATIKLASK
ncbi:MAG TPA: hypothetical protein PKD90_07700 [Phnomibacter sp.]|nr:hypothetical protein [Phnomibacter sp.]